MTRMSAEVKLTLELVVTARIMRDLQRNEPQLGELMLRDFWMVLYDMVLRPALNSLKSKCEADQMMTSQEGMCFLVAALFDGYFKTSGNFRDLHDTLHAGLKSDTGLNDEDIEQFATVYGKTVAPFIEFARQKYKL